MTSAAVRRAGAILVSALLLASLAAVTIAAPAAAKPTCMGKPATIVGTSKGEVIRGTSGRDVIVALGGNDVVYGHGGYDLICGGPGHDRLVGGRGRDHLYGNTGKDRLLGGAGRDYLYGGPGRDTLNGGSATDYLRGGPDDDRLNGGQGHDHLEGNLGYDHCHPGPGAGPHYFCEDVPSLPRRNLAIAWSDLDGNHRYGPGDVLINRLFDTNGDGIPSPGDTIYTGRAPIDFAMTAFTDWGVESLTVEKVVNYGVGGMRVETGGYRVHSWGDSDEYHEYGTAPAYATSWLRDSCIGCRGDYFIRLDPESPSQPSIRVAQVGNRNSAGDQRFIDVVVYP